MNFWRSLPKPFVGLAPMDGVTDAPFREIVDLYGEPNVLFTEFMSVDAIAHNPSKALISLDRHKSKTPTVAQLYGLNLEAYRWATIIICELGFDGIDINMGCPAKSIASRGAGAGLIKQPAHADKIVQTVCKTTSDWFNGTLSLQDVPPDLAEAVRIKLRDNHVVRKELPVSVKTRIGYGSVNTEEWIGHLSSLKMLSALIIHGRTYAQGYGGNAQWDEIKKASEIAHTLDPEIIIVGNGDVSSREQAEQFCRQYSVDGVLIGRKSLGNPWAFSHVLPSQHERVKVALHHARLIVNKYPQKPFVTLRKHLPWYITGIQNAAEIRHKLSSVQTLDQLEEILNPLLQE